MTLLGDFVQTLWVVITELPLILIKLLYLCGVAVYKFVVPVKFRSKDVHGETVLITGGGSGLGRLLAIKLARLGCNIVIWDVNKEGNELTAQMIRNEGGSVHAYHCDLCDKNAIYRVADQVKSEVGDVDILINNAGIVSGRKFLDTPDELVQRTMDVNINAHFWTVKAFLPSMMERNHGHIVTIASTAGLVGVNGLVDYHASKFAAVGFDEALRDELYCMGKDVHTTCVCPTFISTGMFQGVDSKVPLILPMLTPDYVTDRIIDAILTNQHMLIIPRVILFMMAIKWWLPQGGYNVLAQFSGGSQSMDTFVGKKSD